jgi:hypothetical protein
MATWEDGTGSEVEFTLELVEDHPVGDARAMAAKGMVGLAGGQQRGELVPQGFQNARWQGRHKTSA